MQPNSQDQGVYGRKQVSANFLAGQGPVGHVGLFHTCIACRLDQQKLNEMTRSRFGWCSVRWGSTGLPASAHEAQRRRPSAVPSRRRRTTRNHYCPKHIPGRIYLEGAYEGFRRIPHKGFYPLIFLPILETSSSADPDLRPQASHVGLSPSNKPTLKLWWRPSGLGRKPSSKWIYWMSSILALNIWSSAYHSSFDWLPSRAGPVHHCPKRRPLWTLHLAQVHLASKNTSC